MIGKTLKSKINGALFYVQELKEERGKQYYVIRDVKTGRLALWEKGWFEKGLMQNLETVDGTPQRGDKE